VIGGFQPVAFQPAFQQGTGPTPAGRHHKRYGVLDGNTLLVFNTLAEANAAKAAIAARAAVAAKPALKRVKVKPMPKPEERIPLAATASLAAAAGQTADYRALLSAKAYTDLVAMHDALRRADAMRREEEEVAMHLLHEDWQARKAALVPIAHIVMAIRDHIAKRLH